MNILCWVKNWKNKQFLQKNSTKNLTMFLSLIKTKKTKQQNKKKKSCTISHLVYNKYSSSSSSSSKYKSIGKIPGIFWTFIFFFLAFVNLSFWVSYIFRSLFYNSRDVDENWKHEIEFIIISNESLAESKTKNENE